MLVLTMFFALLLPSKIYNRLILSSAENVKIFCTKNKVQFCMWRCTDDPQFADSITHISAYTVHVHRSYNTEKIEEYIIN